MEDIKLQQFNKAALDLFSQSAKAFESSSSKKVQSQAKFVPKKFVDEDKKIRIVFVGQYSAGKSSILSILTGQQLEIGQGVTTNQCNYLDWNGVEVVDTPGIHTQKRPDHDEITYNAMAEADLIVFVCTVEGFSQGLGDHFRKLLVDKGKGNEMMLVFNKMEDSKYGNTLQGQEAFFKCDVLPVISPEFTGDDLFLTFVDTYAYQDSLVAQGDDKRQLLEMSGYETLIQNINKFIQKKKVLGKCTTSLYRLEQLLSSALSEFKTGDFCVDGALSLLNQQREAIAESRNTIKSNAYSIVRRNTQEVRQWGYDIADNLSSADSADSVNQQLKDKYALTNSIYEKSAKELVEVIELENEKLQKFASSLAKSEFVGELKSSIERGIGDIKMSEQVAGNLKKGADAAGKAGEFLAKFAQGPNAQTGWNAIFKLGNYSGSNAHQTVLEVGHFLGHKFKPWEAVKIASKIGKFGKILGVGGALLGVGLQIWSDQQESKAERQLLEYRGDIRNTFCSAAETIEMEFDQQTQTWIEKAVNPMIADIDDKINTIVNEQNRNDEEFAKITSLLNHTRLLISEIQQSV